jgi:hypothetical protein
MGRLQECRRDVWGGIDESYDPFVSVAFWGSYGIGDAEFGWKGKIYEGLDFGRMNKHV